MPYVVLSGEREVISQLSILSLFLNSFVTLADLKSSWGFRIKCWDLSPELSTPASQKVSVVRMPAGAVNTTNRRNTYPLCWVKEWKQGGLQINLSPSLCALAGQALFFLQPGFQLSNTCSFPGSKQILQGLSWCPFLYPSAIPKGCLSLCLSWLQRQNSPRELVSSTPAASPPLASPVATRGRAALCPKGICWKGSQGPGQASPLLSYSLLEEHVAGRELLNFKQVNNEKPSKTGLEANLT